MTTKPTEAGIACPAEEDLVAYLVNELDPVEQDGVRRHLADCSLCRANAEGYRGTISTLDMAEAVPVFRDLAPSILDQIAAMQREEKTPPYRILRLPQIWLRIAASLTLAAGTAYLARFAWMSRGNLPSESMTASVPFAVSPGQNGVTASGLTWLIGAQETSGKWDTTRWGGRPEYTIGLTGMALLSLVKSNEDCAGKRECMEQAVAYLLKQQSDSGRLGDAFDGTMYNHGIATVALLEIYEKTKNADLVEPLKKAIAFIQARQLPQGGWGYGTHSSEVANTSISAWPLQALLLAAHEGWGGDENIALKRGLSWLAGVVDDRGQFGYQQSQQVQQGADTLTAMGAYCLLRAANEGFVVDRRVCYRVEQALARQSGQGMPKTDFYHTFFQVNALRETRGNTLDGSLADIRKGLVSQRQDSGPNEGSWNPQDRWGTVGGRIYSTALASLALEEG